MRLHLIIILSALALQGVCAQKRYDLTLGEGKAAAGSTRLTDGETYTAERGYGYDFTQLTAGSATRFVSVRVPDGNYRVSVTLGSKRRAGVTTVRAESRRLLVENAATRRGELRTYTFTVNKRDTRIRALDAATGTWRETGAVRIKKREQSKLDWDERLTIEINGSAPACQRLVIEPADTAVTTLYLCGNSTVVDQDFEPWASWGQMLPRWWDERVAVANYAESGETASTFIAAGRLAKVLSLLRAGDYVFVEFGHNDQKQRFAGAGAYYNFAYCLKQFVDETRRRGATPVLVTPTQRRSFAGGRIAETHGDYPDAMREVARREGVAVIELHDMTRTFYERLGEEGSKTAFVHYAAHTFPHQESALADNTHFNPYGAYEIAKMVVEGLRTLSPPFIGSLSADYVPFDPARPDDAGRFVWAPSPFYEMLKPDGN